MEEVPVTNKLSNKQEDQNAESFEKSINSDIIPPLDSRSDSKFYSDEESSNDSVQETI